MAKLLSILAESFSAMGRYGMNVLRGGPTTSSDDAGALRLVFMDNILPCVVASQRSRCEEPALRLLIIALATIWVDKQGNIW